MSVIDDGPRETGNGSIRNSVPGGCGCGCRQVELRDWFAGQALAGWLSDPCVTTRARDQIAETCYTFADAMIAARKNQRNPES